MSFHMENDPRGSVALTEPESEAAESLDEKHFLLAVERGDIVTVRKELARARREKHININCADPLNRNGLIIAIANEDSDLLYLLLNGGLKPKDALLHAIEDEYVEAVEILLEYEEEMHKKVKHPIPYSWEQMTPELATWTQDVTPLILAGHKNNYEILKILLDRGAAIPIPHDIKCGCDICVTLSHDDSLKYSKSRINAYAALTSPCLISLSSKDPILTAFELSFELRKLSRIENEFKLEYEELRDKVQTFAVDLLHHTRNSVELDIILNYDPESRFEDFEEEDEIERKMGLERLKIAIDCRQKKFVAHPHVQQLLASLWFMHFGHFRRRSMFGQLAGALKIAASFPIYSMAYIAAPNSKIGIKAKLPFVKFLCHSASYMFFLLLLVLVSQRAESMAIKLFGTEWMKEKLRQAEQKERGGFPSFTELLIVWYVICFIWGEIKELWNAGLVDYAKDLWNFVHFFSNTLYLAWITLRVIAWYIVHRELSQGMIAYTPREEWHAFDPMLVGEAMFGAANIFSFLKLVHIFLISPHLGPLQISLGRMVFDIMKFFFFYTLVLFAFACGLNQILSYYADIDKNLCYSLDDPNKPNRDDYELQCDIWRRFTNLFETSQSLFWASFGLVDINSFELSGLKEFTRFWTLLMFGCYSIMNVVVLLNLLIAMMNHSFSIIAERADVEWKFARTKLWMKYFEDGGTVPPPFNIIPTPKSVSRLFMSKSKLGHHAKRIDTFKKREQIYRRTMRCLVRRYITAKQKTTEEQGVTEDDMNELKHEINSFRYTLVDMLLKNGFKGEMPEIGGTVTGKKQLQNERMLMKGFNIDIVEDTDVGEHLRGIRKKQDVFANLVLKAKGQTVEKDWNKLSRSKQQSKDQIGNTERYVDRRATTKRTKKRQNAVTMDDFSEMAKQKVRAKKREEKLAKDKSEYNRASKWGRVAFMTKKGVFTGGSMKIEMMKDIIPIIQIALDDNEMEGELDNDESFDTNEPLEDEIEESKVMQYGRRDFIIKSPTPEPPTSPEAQHSPLEPEVGEQSAGPEAQHSPVEPEVGEQSGEPEVGEQSGEPEADEPLVEPESMEPPVEPQDLLKVEVAKAGSPPLPKLNTTHFLDMEGPVTDFFTDDSSSAIPPEPEEPPQKVEENLSRQSPSRRFSDFDEDIKFKPLPKVNPFKRPHMEPSSKPATPHYKVAPKPPCQKAAEIKPLPHTIVEVTPSKVPSFEIVKEVQSEDRPLLDSQVPKKENEAPVSSVRNARQFFENQAKPDTFVPRRSPMLPKQSEINGVEERFMGKKPDDGWRGREYKSYTDTMVSSTSSTGHFVPLPKTNPVLEHVSKFGNGSAYPPVSDEEDFGKKPSRPQVIKIKKSAPPINYQGWNPPEPKWMQAQQQKEKASEGTDHVIQDGPKKPKEMSREPTPVPLEAEVSTQNPSSPQQGIEKKPQPVKKHKAPSPPLPQATPESKSPESRLLTDEFHPLGYTPSPSGWM